MNISAEYIDQLNRETIDAQDLRTIIQAIAAQPTGLRSFESTVALIMELIPERSSNYRVALILRLEALNHVLKNHPYLAGLAADDGAFFIASWMIDAASTCALQPGQSHRVEFDSQYFKAKALAMGRP